MDEITGKGAHFSWNDQRQAAFEQLKKALLQAPVLQLADVSRPFRVYTDASDTSIAAVLMQSKDDNFHPVAYVSRKLTSAQKNYTIAERESLAVVFALRNWRLYLSKHFDVFTDNQAVVYLRTKPHLSKREEIWVQFLAEFHFSVHLVPGKHNTADALTWQEVPISQINNLDLSLELDNENSKLISEGYANDPELAHIIKRLEDSDKDAFHDRYLWDPIGKKLYFIGPESARLCIPKGPVQLQLLKDSHDCLFSGHPGRDRTFSNLSQHFFWPMMSTDVKNFVRSCEFC